MVVKHDHQTKSILFDLHRHNPVHGMNQKVHSSSPSEKFTALTEHAVNLLINCINVIHKPPSTLNLWPEKKISVEVSPEITNHQRTVHSLLHSELTTKLFIRPIMTVHHPVTDLLLQKLGVESVGAGANQLITAVRAVPEQVTARQPRHTLPRDTAELVPGTAGRRGRQGLVWNNRREGEGPSEEVFTGCESQVRYEIYGMSRR